MAGAQPHCRVTARKEALRAWNTPTIFAKSAAPAQNWEMTDTRLASHGLAIVSIVGGIATIIPSVIPAVAWFTNLHRRVGLGEALMVDERARQARERLAEKIRPSDAPRAPEAS